MSPSAPERRLQRLEWTALRRLDGLLQGDYRTIFKGQGLDLADIREYAFGDRVRHIDWNVTGRLDAPYVREYLEDREINAHFLLDLSPSVDFGTVDRRKRDLLIDFTAALARLLTRDGTRAGRTARRCVAGRTWDPRARRSFACPSHPERSREAPASSERATHVTERPSRLGGAGTQAAVAGLRDLRFLQRGRLGTAGSRT